MVDAYSWSSVHTSCPRHAGPHQENLLHSHANCFLLLSVTGEGAWTHDEVKQLMAYLKEKGMLN
jgi:hypothetical protein